MSNLTTVSVCVDRHSAIRAGINGIDSPVDVEIDVSRMSQEDRDDIAERLEIDKGAAILRRREKTNDQDFGRVCRSWRMTVDDPSEVGILAVMAADRQAISDRPAVLASRKAAETADRQLRLDTLPTRIHRQQCPRYAGICDGKIYSDNIKHYDTPITYTFERVYVLDCDLKGDPVYDSFDRECRDESDRNELAAREIAIQPLRELLESRAQWIEQNGSIRLKRLAAEGIKHEGVYQAERTVYEDRIMADALATERPGWRVVEEQQLDRAIADVGVRTLALLDAARLVAPDAVLAKLDGKYVAVAEFRGCVIAWPRD